MPTELGAVGLIAGSARPNAAMLFYDWWMGDQGQALLVAGGKYSSRTDLAPPEGSPPLSELKLLVLDYAEYQAEPQPTSSSVWPTSSAASGASDRRRQRRRGAAAAPRPAAAGRRRPS